MIKLETYFSFYISVLDNMLYFTNIGYFPPLEYRTTFLNMFIRSFDDYGVKNHLVQLNCLKPSFGI